MTVDPHAECSDDRNQAKIQASDLEEILTQELLPSMDAYLDAESKLLACAVSGLKLQLPGPLTSDLWKSIFEELLDESEFSFQDCDTAVSDYSIAKQKFLETHEKFKTSKNNSAFANRLYWNCLREAEFKAARR
jgi:hypothetical protein